MLVLFLLAVASFQTLTKIAFSELQKRTNDTMAFFVDSATMSSEDDATMKFSAEFGEFFVVDKHDPANADVFKEQALAVLPQFMIVVADESRPEAMMKPFTRDNIADFISMKSVTFDPDTIKSIVQGYADSVPLSYLQKEHSGLVVFFTSENRCSHCRRVFASFGKAYAIASKKNQHLSAYTVDCDHSKELCASLGVKTLPTIFFAADNIWTSYEGESFTVGDLESWLALEDANRRSDTRVSSASPTAVTRGSLPLSIRTLISDLEREVSDLQMRVARITSQQR